MYMYVLQVHMFYVALSNKFKPLKYNVGLFSGLIVK